MEDLPLDIYAEDLEDEKVKNTVLDQNPVDSNWKTLNTHCRDGQNALHASEYVSNLPSYSIPFLDFLHS